MDRIRAPYNFVPVSEHVCVPGEIPALVASVTHDAPFREGIRARIQYRVVAETPIFVRGEGESARDGATQARFFRTPDENFAIPGSAVRGMLRNVVEVAGFGKLARVNDHTYGVRDLHNRDVYGRYMAEIRDVPDPRGRGTKKEPVPLVSAAWLRKRDVEDGGDVVAELTPCDFYKIEYRRVMALAASRGLNAFNPGRKQSSVEKYTAWGDRSLDAQVEVRTLRPLHQRSQAGVPFLGEMGVVVDRGARVEGRLVFTGQPAEWRPDMAARRGGGHPKHHDFVFVPRADGVAEGARKVLVTRRQFEVFEFVHADRGQQRNRLQRTPNEEWAYWKERYEKGEAVPVFVLPERDGTVRAFGLAMMFRLAYKHSVRESVRVAQPDSGSNAYDLPELIFGHVSLEARAQGTNESALKGRVSFGLARAKGTPRELDPVRAVLGAPKASYYPNYVEQSDDPYNPGAPPSGEYKTFMNDDARVRGWKRYRPHARAELRPALPPKSKPSVQTVFRPLDAGVVFEGVMRVHNLRPEELGAIVWASRFGGDAGARHTLGMARSLGFGRVRVELVPEGALTTNEGVAITLAECESRFVASMEQWARTKRLPGGWRGSLQIAQLVACAQPFPAGSDEGRHMRIEQPNEFVEAKKDRLALPPAGDVNAWRAKTEGVPVPAAQSAKTGAGTVASSGAVVAGGRAAGGGIAAKAPEATSVGPTTSARGKIAYFSNGQVGIELDGGRKVKAVLGKAEFKGFAALNGNELRKGRAVTVALAGENVVRVEA